MPDSRLLAAVRATEGQVLLDDHHEFVDSYFGASCGGETANIGRLWGKNPPAYLRGVHDEFCVAGSHANWTDVVARADLLRALQSDVRTDVGGRLDQIVVSRRDESGRAEFITLEGERRKTVRGWDFKIIVGRVLGWNVLKSSRFDVARSGANFIFRGSGFGHGLGLCQEGAHVMAARGASYQKILEKYFPGTSVGRDTETRAGADAGTRGRGDAANIGPGNQWKADVLSTTTQTSFFPASPRPRVSASHLNVSRMVVLSSEHLRLTYPADIARRDADQVMSILESARSDFLHRASAAGLTTAIPALEIRLNDSTGDFVGRTGQPWWAAAATKGNRIELQPLAILKRRGVLSSTLRHELAHVVIDMVSRDRAPRWLEEGFAIYLAGEGRLFSHNATRSALSTEDLEKSLERPGSQQEMRTLYARAYLAVKELVRNGGEASVWKKVAGN
jgi:SpoIID/LytB domain protein